MNKNTLVINYNTLSLGGIEKYLYRLSKFLIKKGYRVVWLCDKRQIVYEEYRELFLSSSIERYEVNVKGLHWFKHPFIHFDKDENVVIVSFTPTDMVMAEKLMLENPNLKITPFYIIPHVTGNRLYIERCFPPLLRNMVKSRMTKILKRWVDMDVIRFFSKTQIQPFVENYNIIINNPQSKILKAIEGWKELDEKLLLERTKRKEFNVITVGRFDFPHKGYMLGLVRAIGRLKPKYPQLQLFVVGCGKGEFVLREEIEKLPKDYRSSVHLEGPIAPDNLEGLMSKMHMNISCAGAVADGARFGVLSIPARNYCEGECEVYGYLPDSRDKATSMDPGLLVDSFIMESIEMSQDEYERKCRDSYHTYKDAQVVDPLYLFHTHDEAISVYADNQEVQYVRNISYGMKLFNRIDFIFNGKAIN